MNHEQPGEASPAAHHKAAHGVAERRGDSLKVLTVRQPWAWALGVGIKDIENRTWWTSYRGPLAIQASARLPPRNELDGARDFIGDRGVAVPPDPELALGAIVAVVELVECVTASASPWFEGPVGWVVRDARQTVEPLPLKGQLGLFDLGEDAERLLMRSLRVKDRQAPIKR